MAKYYIKEYTGALKDKLVMIACREGILRDHFREIVADIKFLTRQGIRTVFFHNLSNRFANQQHFNTLASRLPDTRIVRVPANTDFHEYVFGFQKAAHKIIFLERKYLIDAKGLRINTLTTGRARKEFDSYADVIGNANFKAVITRICDMIHTGKIERVHILPAGKNTIRQELFSIEGSGTLIADNFKETLRPVETRHEITLLMAILKKYRGSGFLKTRTMDYIRKHRDRFFMVEIDDIPVGCCEEIVLDDTTVELGAVAIATKFTSQRVGFFLVTSFIGNMRKKGISRIISLTKNPRLAGLYQKLGFVKKVPADLVNRKKQSPGVSMFVLEIRQD